ncbi:hypothetical protein HHX47_DHR3000557 [Lentinula edodes]|nr:hypothetical protein HHX47_DHR3000557 [Lentinula edodes]
MGFEITHRQGGELGKKGGQNESAGAERNTKGTYSFVLGFGITATTRIHSTFEQVGNLSYMFREKLDV